MPEQTPRELALQFADQMVGAWVGAVKNERGYAHDKWQPTDVEARTEAVLRLAEFLLAKAAAGGVVAAAPHLHRASCHDEIGMLVCGFPPDGPTIASQPPPRPPVVGPLAG